MRLSPFSRLLSGNRCRFCNSPSISCSFCPSLSTFPPNNHAPFRRRNRGKPLCPYIREPARQISFRNSCICTVKKAFSPSVTAFSLLYPLMPDFASNFTYKTALPDKKLSKKPATSTPAFSNAPIKCCGVATPYTLSR